MIGNAGLIRETDRNVKSRQNYNQKQPNDSRVQRGECPGRHEYFLRNPCHHYWYLKMKLNLPDQAKVDRRFF